MAPPLTIALIQSRPILDPLPHTIVAPLLISNAIYHKCRISDHLHLVFQWGIHTSLFTKRQVAAFTTVYTPPALARALRKHEGHPARAPDGTIMEIAGEACPGDTGESVGPWDLGNVQMCEGFSEWAAALSQTLSMAFATGLKIEDVNFPKPEKGELEKANGVDSHWLNGRPLHSTVRKILLAHRDGIRDKLDAFLVFIDGQILSVSGREKVFKALREALDGALVGDESREYHGVVGGMINKIVDRVEELIKYVEEKIEVKEARQYRVDEVREIVDGALKTREKEKRKRDDEGEVVEGERKRKRFLTEDTRMANEQTLMEELTEGLKKSKAHRKAKSSRARKREPKKTKPTDPAAEKNKGKDKGADANSMISEAKTSQKFDQEKKRADEFYSCEQTIKKSESDSSSQISTGTAKATEAESYSNSCPSLRDPVTPSPPLNQSPGSPPPPYSEFSTPISSDAEASSYAPTTQETRQTTPNSFYSEQTAGERAIVNAGAPSPDPTTPETRQRSESSAYAEQTSSSTPISTPTPETRLRMASAAKILEQILNPGRRRRRKAIEEDISSPLAPSAPSGEKDEDVPTPPSDTEPERTQATQIPDVVATSGDIHNTPPPSQFSSSPPSPAELVPQEPGVSAKDANAETELEPESAKQDEEIEDEESLFLPQILAEPAPTAPATLATLPQRESSYDYEFDLPPPPPKEPRSGSSRLPIDIDLIPDLSPEPNHNHPSRSSTPHPHPPDKSKPSQNIITIEDEDCNSVPSTSSAPPSRRPKTKKNVVTIKDEDTERDYIEIKDEDAERDYIEIKDEDEDVDVKPVKIEDEVMLCDRDEWVREVKEKHRRIRRGGWQISNVG